MRCLPLSQANRIARILVFAALILTGVLPAGPLPAQDRAPLKFEARTIETNAVLWWARALGDVNGDGLLDLLLQDNNGHGGVLCWYGAHDGGTRWTRHVIAEKAPNGSPFAAGALAAGDINNNGHLDVLGLAHPGEWKKAGAPTEIYWYENPRPKGDPARDAWTPHRIGRAPACLKDVKLADFNGDGKLDLVAITFEGNRFLVFRQDTPASWTKVQDFAIGNLHEGLDVGDITGNGRPDVATNGYWVENPGGDLTGAWTVRSIDEKWHNQTGDWSRNATKVFCRDLTGDGRAEVFLSHSERAGYPVSWYHAEDPRQGPWKEHVITDKLIAVHTLQVFDFDGDGHYDVLAGMNKSRARALGATEFPALIFRNRGDNLKWDEFLLTNDGIYNGQVGDLQGNGRLDIFRLPTHDATVFEVLVNTTPTEAKERVFVLTDISNEPDDEQSLVRFLVYANDYEVEGLVATTSTWLRNKTREDLIRRQIEAYGQVRDNLLRHAGGFPTREHLLSVTRTGQPGFGMAHVGDGRGTPGSQWLIEAADRDDPRPLWISVWGGANTLAQALWDVRASRSPAEVQRLVSRLRVYTISDQDDAGPWLRREFPELFYIVSPSRPDSGEYHRATWTGISGDRHYRNGPGHYFELVDNPWLQENIIRDHGPLGALYPLTAYIMEGDTPSFLGLIQNGLGWHVNPGYGGWGGRYLLYHCYGETRPIWTNHRQSRDTVTAENGQVHTSDQATIWRWRKAYQHDFAARMDWCVAEAYDKANHNPVAVLNGDTSRRIIEIAAQPGETVRLTAAGSSDPDGDTLAITWFVYPEAGAFRGEVALAATTGETTSLVAPTVKKPETIHVILQIEDSGSPSLFAYRRAIITVQP